MSSTGVGTGLQPQETANQTSNEVNGEEHESINVRVSELLERGRITGTDSPVYASASLQLEEIEPQHTQDQQGYVASAFAHSQEDTLSTVAGTIASQDHVEQTTDFSLHDHNMTEQHQFEHEAAARNYCDVLRDILGSSAASPAAAADVLIDDTGENIWDQFLDAGQPFADLTGFSFVDLAPFDIDTALNTSVTAGRQEHAVSFEQSAPAATTQAFHVSGWNWGPSPTDNEPAETTHLILPPGIPRPELLQPQLATPNHDVVKPEDRNRLLSMLLKHCEKDQWVRIASTFPSVHFLSHLIQVFCAFQGRITLPWLHLPTTGVQGLRVECLAAIMGTAACFSLNRSVQRFGYVLPELVRFAVIDQVGTFLQSRTSPLLWMQRLREVIVVSR